MTSFGLIHYFVDVCGRNLSHSGSSVACLLASAFLVVFVFQNVFGCSWDLVVRMDVYGFFVEGERTEGVHKEMVELFVNIFLDVFS